MNPLPNIRRARASDLAAVVALLEDAGLPTADIESVETPQFWVLEEGGSIVGAIALERFGAEGLLRSLVIAPEYRNHGFGRELVAQVEQSARTDNVSTLVLLTETAETFFRKLGYSTTDRQCIGDSLKQSAEFRLLCPASAICMSKLLIQRS